MIEKNKERRLVKIDPLNQSKPLHIPIFIFILKKSMFPLLPQQIKSLKPVKASLAMLRRIHSLQ